jgi:hypothetical protein
MIDVSKSHLRIMPIEIENPFKASRLKGYKYDIVNVHYHEGTDVPFFATDSSLESFKDRVAKLEYKTFSENESDAAKAFYRKELRLIQAHAEELIRSLDNLAVKKEDFKQ